MAALLAQYATNMTLTPQNAKMLNKLTSSLPIVNIANAKSLMSKLLDAINAGDDLLANSLMSTLTLAVLNSGSTDPSWIALSDQLKSYQALFELNPSNIFLAEQLASARKDCSMSPWSAWSPCDTKGTQTQTRSILSPSENGGSPCLSLVQGSNCPVECSVGPWSSFGECSQPCGGGTRSQSRNILVPALFGGTQCPSLSNVQACNSNACPIDCSVGPWSSWSSCDKTGNMTRDRSVIAKDLYGGAACPTLRESSNCPVACEVSEWSPFDSCTKACGGGFQSQSRTIKSNTLFGGTSCPPLRNEQACNSNPCPLSCVTSEWSSWSPCSNGVTRRSMSIVTPAAYGGSCPDPSLMVQSSNCPLDCVVGPWTTWSACTSNGLLNRSRSITVQPLYGGAICPPLTGSSNCPVDCVVGDWSTCTAPCGGGTQTRVIVTPAAYGGLACPALTQTCNTQACPVPCVGSWSDWSACSSNCGGGKQTQTYTINIPSAYGGTMCPSSNGTVNTQPCNTQACPVNCLGSWGSFGACSVTCGGGTQTQTYIVNTPAANGGTACPVNNNATNAQACNSQACIVSAGGDMLNYVKNGLNYVSHAFWSKTNPMSTISTTFTLSVPKTIDILIVGGGGGGGDGNAPGGGGGGGGVLRGSLNLPAGTYSITGGAGGRGPVNNDGAGYSGAKGENMTFSGTGISVTANGGGYGASYTQAATTGGSGGGGSGPSTNNSGINGGQSGASTPYGSLTGYVNSGANYVPSWEAGGSWGAGGGGGGAGGAATGKNGGPGLLNDYRTGGAEYFGGGGGGAGSQQGQIVSGAGGSGVGGNGGYFQLQPQPQTNALNGYGGGGGGSSDGFPGDYKGGNGCVILRYST